MKFSEEQLEQYRTLGYVIFDCPFPESLTVDCMAAVEKAAQDPSEGPADGSKRNHFYLRPQVDDSYWCSLDHSLPFLKVILHPEFIELGRQLNGVRGYLSAQRGHQRAGPEPLGVVAPRRRAGMGGVHALLLRGVARERVSAHRSGQSHRAAHSARGEGRQAQGGAGELRLRQKRTAGRTSSSTRRFPWRWNLTR